MSGSSNTPHYPAPNIVVGLGRFGLSVLERVGRDWAALDQSSTDPSLKNLRLLHVRADDDAAEADWRRGERQFVEIARYTGDGDLPTLALDFIILRSLGLIRYRNGTYQVAIPRDEGVVEVPADHRDVAVPADEADADTPPVKFARQRYFDWVNLSPDPISSVERLRVLQARQPDLDLFITPLVNRVRQGHSPRTALACISRCRALADGRDPWPFGWLFQPLVDGAIDQPKAGHDGFRQVNFDRHWLVANDVRGYLDGLAEAPIAGWKSWADGLRQRYDDPNLAEVELPDGGFPLTLPDVFMPRPSDLSSPIRPGHLLKVDWETTGWATKKIHAGASVEFDPVEASPFRLGLFDHDTCSRVHAKRARPGGASNVGDGHIRDGHIRDGADFGDRLRELAIHAHRGMVRMWVDLQRERVETVDEETESTRRRESVDDSLDQSLEVLGELLVRPLITRGAAAEPGPDTPAQPDRFGRASARDGRSGDGQSGNGRSGDGRSGDGQSSDGQSSDGQSGDGPKSADRDQPLGLDDQASGFLRQLVVEDPPPENAAQQALDRRLGELGFDPPDTDDARRMLFGQVSLQADDVTHEPDDSTIVDPDVVNQRSAGMVELRTHLNERTRQLFDYSYLRQYRDKPVRRSPRLTIYVVCDATEAFARSSARAVLREIHAELLRAFGPIFETFREGFDRALSVVPIIWMPHPADTFGGSKPMANRGEEAAIIEAIQGVRRWAESIPAGKCCIPQLIINSRVTDNAVVSVADSIRQTRDFLTFQMRNDLSDDPWLRRTATAKRGDDLFASFSCHEISFPAHKAREYLANRYARQSLERLEHGDHGSPPEVADEPIEPPEIDALVDQPGRQLADQTGRAADTVERQVRGRLQAGASTGTDEVETQFGADFEAQLLQDIQRQWQDLTERRGQMDDMVDALRRDTSTRLADTLDTVKAVGDRLIDDHASKGGLKRAHAGFDELRALARQHLRRRERDRRDKQSLCLEHRIPQTAPVGAARAGVVEAGRQKPDQPAMRVAMVMWALLAPVIGAPICWAIAKAFELPADPGVAEFMLGPLGPLVGGLLVGLPVLWLLRHHMQTHVERLQRAIDRMGEAAHRVVDGGANALSATPSIRSFMEARLVHTAALATRNYAGQVYERSLRDLELASRLRRSVDLQRDALMRYAEDLGVQTKMADIDSDRGEDDVSRLFDGPSSADVDRLIDPERLTDYYRRRIGDQRQIDQMLERFIDEVGGFDQWRKTASLGDTDEIMAHSRTRFSELVEQPVSQQFVFADEVCRRLLSFVRSNYSNIGFGAKFSGYEGLDADGVDILAKTALVLHPKLLAVFEEARKDPAVANRMQTLEIKTAPVAPNAAYMMSLVQGIRPHSVRNLRRFESFYHRAQLPDDRTFPLSGESRQRWESSPVNHLSGYDEVGDDIYRQVANIIDGVEDDSEVDDG